MSKEIYSNYCFIQNSKILSSSIFPTSTLITRKMLETNSINILHMYIYIYICIFLAIIYMFFLLLILFSIFHIFI